MQNNQKCYNKSIRYNTTKLLVFQVVSIMDYSLFISAFIAGILMFLAPCTFPLVPAFLGYLSGVSADGLYDEQKRKEFKKIIFIHAVFYVLGFSLVFISFGIAASGIGLFLFEYRPILQKIGALFIMFLGIFLLGIVKLPFFQKEFIIKLPRPFRRPGKISSIFFGASMAVGWTPCVGPILGAVLTVAATRTQVFQGFTLLSVFSLGLAIPFLLAALGLGSFIKIVKNYYWILNGISAFSGILLVFIGVLIFIDRFPLLMSYGYWFLKFINYQSLINYL